MHDGKFFPSKGGGIAVLSDVFSVSVGWFWRRQIRLSRVILLGATALAPSATFAATAAPEAQKELDVLLSSAPRSEIAKGRAACATGNAGVWQQMLRESGFQSPPAGAWCVTVLTRAGRDGTLGYVRDPQTSTLAPSFAFDNGFVGGYLKRAAIPQEAPPMTALLPIVDRCLRQQEPNTKLCGAAGFVLGARAAHGEVVALG